jgi:hypothetical protein
MTTEPTTKHIDPLYTIDVDVYYYFVLLLFVLTVLCIIHPCGSSKYKYKQTKQIKQIKHRKHRKLQFDDIIGYTQ